MADLAFPEEILLRSQAEPSGCPQAGQKRERAMHRLASLGEMTGGIAHDFRNLLAVIESGLRLAERKADQPESVRTYLSAAREGVDRGVELASQLLDFANCKELVIQPHDLNELVKSSEPFLRYGAGPNIRVRLALGSDVPRCQIDPSLFDAAVLNLVFTPGMPCQAVERFGSQRSGLTRRMLRSISRRRKPMRAFESRTMAAA